MQRLHGVALHVYCQDRVQSKDVNEGQALSNSFIRFVDMLKGCENSTDELNSRQHKVYLCYLCIINVINVNMK